MKNSKNKSSLKFVKKDKRTYYAHTVEKRGKVVGYICRPNGFTVFTYHDAGEFKDCFTSVLNSKELREISDFMNSLDK